MDVNHTLEIAIYIVNQLKNDSYQFDIQSSFHTGI